MKKEKNLHDLSSENKTLKSVNKNLQEELHLTRQFQIDNSIKNIEYIYHIGQLKSGKIYKLFEYLGSLFKLNNVPKKHTDESRKPENDTSYAAWIAKYDTLTNEDKKQISTHITHFDHQYKFSLIIIDHKITRKSLESTILSLRKQLFYNWEAFIINTDSLHENLFYEFKTIFATDQRIKFIKATHEAETIKIVMSEAVGDFFAIINPGDTLNEDCLYAFAAELDFYPNAQCIYSDEDSIDETGKRSSPCFKTDWNIELFLSQNFIGGLCILSRDVFSNAIIHSSTRWKTEEIYFYALTETIRSSVRHIPIPLYHRLNLEKDTNNCKWLHRSLELVQHYFNLRKINVDLLILKSNPDIIKIVRKIPEPEPLVTIIIPTHNRPDLVETCLSGLISKTHYRNIEIIIIDHENTHPDAIRVLKSYGTNPQVTIMSYQGVFDHSRMNNKAAEIARGEILLFLNDDIEIIQADWLHQIVSYFSEDDCGVVGAKLLYPNHTIQHGGVILGFGGVAGHSYVGRAENDAGYFERLNSAMEVSALTGACMAIRTELFERVGGFSAYNLQRTFNDVDLCLKAHKSGMINIFTPYATLIHHESATDGGDIKLTQYKRLQREVRYMLNNWGLMQEDPYYNVNLSLESRNFDLAFPPRRQPIWKTYKDLYHNKKTNR